MVGIGSERNGKYKLKILAFFGISMNSDCVVNSIGILLVENNFDLILYLDLRTVDVVTSNHS